MTTMDPLPAQPDDEGISADDLVGDIDVDNDQIAPVRWRVVDDGDGPSDDEEWEG